MKPLSAPDLPSVRLRDWYARGDFFDFGAHRIFYRQSENWAASTLPILLMVHGFPTASFDWWPLWVPLSPYFRLLAPDLLGFGWSSKPRPHRYSVLEQAHIVEALMTHKQVNDCHLLAHDYGDTVAQELLARHNERSLLSPSLRLLSVTLLNGGLFPESHRPRLIQKLLLSPIGPWLARRLNRQRFGNSFSFVFSRQHQPSAAELDEFWALIARDDGHLLAPLLLSYIPERKQHRERWVGALMKADVPIRLINGLDDPISGAHMVARYRALIDNPDVVELPGIGHYPQLEVPGRVAEAILCARLIENA